MRSADWVLALGVLALAACGGYDDWQPIPTGGENISAPPVMIGLLYAHGPWQNSGYAARDGAAMAVSDINARGGVLGRPVQLLMEIGSGHELAFGCRSTSPANKMIASQVVLVVNAGICASFDALQISAAPRILQISPFDDYFFPYNVADLAAARGLANVFRIQRGDSVGIAIGNFVADHYSDANIAIISDLLARGRVGLRSEITKRQLNQRRIHERLFVADFLDPEYFRYRGLFMPSGEDYSPLIAKLKNEQIDVVIWVTLDDEFLRQARLQGIKATMIWDASGPGSMIYFISQRTSDASGDAEGVLAARIPDPCVRPEAAQILARFQRKCPNEPAARMFTFYTYASVQVWAQAVEIAKSFDADAVAKVLRSRTFDTALGPLAFDANGDVVVPLWKMYVWRNGAYIEM